MRTHITNSRYKILVLMDKSKASDKTLKDAVNLAKLIDGSIDIFQVEPPTSIVKNENQIASMRAIDEERLKQDLALKGLVNTIREEENLPVVGNFTFGNVKNEIKNHIEKTNPDIVVLGKRKKKIIGILGDQITKDLINSYPGAILISSSKKGLSNYDSKSIGFLDTIDALDNSKLISDLKHHIKKPFKVFKNSTKEGVTTTTSAPNSKKNKELLEDAIVYEFDAKNQSVTDMANFISKNDLALLCVRKNENEHSSDTGKLDKLITRTIEKTNVPVLVLNSNLN